MRIGKAILTAAAIGGLATAANAAPPVQAPQCHVGAWRLDNGRAMIVTPTDKGNLRYRLSDGRSAKLFATDGDHFKAGSGWDKPDPVTAELAFGACGENRLRFQPVGAAAFEGRRIAHRILPAQFASSDVSLYGELHLPEKRTPRAIVILQFGSGARSAVAYNYVQHLLPLSDVGVFVFDKRGTGRSTGQLTVRFDTLSDDLAAAVRHVRALPEARGIAIGTMGESQGGWVVPLAATKAPVDFAIISYGLAISPIEENRQQVLNDLRADGYDAAVLARAEEVITATNRIMNTRFAAGLDELRSLRALYGKQDWFAKLSGDFTGLLANTPEADLGKIRAAFDFPYTLDYDPLPALKALTIPSLWVLAGKDTEAPSDTTLAILRDRQAAGAPVDIAVFPNADHGMIEVEGGTNAATRTLQGRNSPGYFDLLARWSRDRRLGAPGKDMVTLPRR